MENAEYKVLITTSGTGSRLGELTKDTNKALVPINNKPSITYVIEAYPKDVRLVITIGYLAQQVKDFFKTNYTDRQIEFVQVDNYDGKGSSLGYSMLQAKDKLQCPFIFHACDTIVEGKIPCPEENWIGGYVTDWQQTDLHLNQYRTHTMKDGKVTNLNEKGVPNFDSIHIGLTGIKDYQKFWQALESIYQADPDSPGHSDVHVVDKMIHNGQSFKWVPFSVWLDTGNMESLKRTENYLQQNRYFS